jgi:hypothetical protein
VQGKGKGNVQLTVGDGPCATSPLPSIGGTVFRLVLTPRAGGWDNEEHCVTLGSCRNSEAS